MRVILVILVCLSLLVLAAGSLAVVLTLLVVKPGKTFPQDYFVVLQVVFQYVWPVALFGAGLLMVAALVVSRRASAGVLLLLLVVVLYMLVRVALRLIVAVAMGTGGQFPMRGVAAALVIALFLTLNGAALYVAIRYVLGGGTIRLVL